MRIYIYTMRHACCCTPRPAGSNLNITLGSPKVRRRAWENMVNHDGETLQKIAIAITKGLKSGAQVGGQCTHMLLGCASACT